MSFLDLVNLRKSFASVDVVRDFSLAVDKGEFVSFLGPSGCGKTTVLRLVAGFETPDTGRITIGGRDVTRLRPNQRNIGMVFQAYALFPNLTVAGNVAFGLRIKRMSRRETADRVAEMLALIGLEALGDRYPFQLSGGQQQRVALARALAPRPEVLLLDEPLSALDAKIRVSLRNEIREIQQRLGITTIFVTHDQEEALSISDRIVVMHKGAADQIGTPYEVYNHPTTNFVASFVGTLSQITGQIVDAGSGQIRFGDALVTLGRPVTGSAGDEITVALRPEALRLLPAPDGPCCPAIVRDVQFLGSVVRIRAQTLGREVNLDIFNRSDAVPPRPGEAVTLGLDPAGMILMSELG